MSDNTAIEWTDATWNPATGCDRVSEGCDHCYALTLAKRLKAMGNVRYQRDGNPRTSGPGFGLTLHHDKLNEPLRWRTPKTVFVNSMSDLFHDDVPDGFIKRVFSTMARAPHHHFQILTKRPGRMASLLNRPTTRSFIVNRAASENPVAGMGAEDHLPLWQLPNVWLGTSVETQKWADVRIPKLLETPAAVRFLSVEPLLGPVDLGPWLWQSSAVGDCSPGGLEWVEQAEEPKNALHWVIVGGESGPAARPMHPDWARALRDQCGEAAIPFFFKQWGGRTPKAGGRELDGRTWEEMPGMVSLSASAR